MELTIQREASLTFSRATMTTDLSEVCSITQEGRYNSKWMIKNRGLKYIAMDTGELTMLMSTVPLFAGETSHTS